MNNVYVIKWKYDKDRNLKYHVDEMILSDENIRYFWCRKLIYKDREFYNKRANCRYRDCRTALDIVIEMVKNNMIGLDYLEEE